MRLWLVLLALVISAAWYWSATVSSARLQLDHIRDEIENLRWDTDADSVTLAELSAVVTDSNYTRDTSVVRRFDELIYRMELRKTSVDSLWRLSDSLRAHLRW